MKFYLQFGHGMMEHCRHLIRKWGNGTVVLSPRDLNREQIETFSQDICDSGGETLLDPQFYDPRGDHHGLLRHTYWPGKFDTSSFMAGPQLNTLIGELLEVNNSANTSKIILPGLYGHRVDDDWLDVQAAIIEESINQIKNRGKLATICLSGESLRFEEQIEDLLNASEEWDVEGYYVVPEHPNGAYLSEDPMWLNNLLMLCSGLKLQGREVIVGYSGHQMLCLSCANVDAIAAGTWLNVRSFSVGKFQEPEEDSISRRSKWYYCPQALSEYKIPFLDLGFKKGGLSRLMTPGEYSSEYANILFSGAQPSTTNYSEQQSFRHYLTCLHYQCKIASKDTFQETVTHQRTILATAEQVTREASRAGVSGQDRDFRNLVDVNRAAIDSFVNSRAFTLERSWS